MYRKLYQEVMVGVSLYVIDLTILSEFAPATVVYARFKLEAMSDVNVYIQNIYL